MRINSPPADRVKAMLDNPLNTQKGLQMLRKGIVFIVFLLWAGVCEAAENPFPGVAKSYVLYHDEHLLWAHKPRLKLPPASLVKMMTALIALEHRNLTEVVSISVNAERALGAKIGLRAGEKWLMRDLLTAALVRSANDACLAIAEHISGNEESFVRIMNKNSHLRGLRNTKFANACGLDHKEQYSTAEDMAMIAFASMKNDTFTRMVNTLSATISPVGGGRSIYFENTNALIGRYPWAKGIKTGFTSRAGKCLAAFAEKDGVRLTLVLLNSPDRWWKAEEMLEGAFEEVKRNLLR